MLVCSRYCVQRWHWSREGLVALQGCRCQEQFDLDQVIAPQHPAPQFEVLTLRAHFHFWSVSPRRWGQHFECGDGARLLRQHWTSALGTVAVMTESAETAAWKFAAIVVWKTAVGRGGPGRWHPFV